MSLISGGSGDDSLDGGSGSDILLGGAGDDTLDGGAGSDLLSGGSGDDTLNGDAGSDLLDGGSGDDVLNGGSGDDILLGGNGEDSLSGGSGDDYLLGGNGSDSLSGGSGDDFLLGQAGGDWLIYSMSQNLGSSDYYDGGSGYDTLVLQLTYGEYLLASVQQDIAAFEAWLDGWRSTAFEFASFDLSASTIEDLKIVLVNNGPTARADAASTGEDGSVTIDVLYNDSDPDHLDALAITAAGAGAVGKVFTDGDNVFYDAGAAFQWLAEGQEVFDTFTYTIEDLGGVAATATVSVKVVGENDPLSIVSAEAGGEVWENAEPSEGGTHEALGTIGFFDIDTSDVHTAIVLPQGAGYRGKLETTVDDAADTAAWSFTVEDSALDDLGRNDVLTQVYNVTIGDGKGGSATQMVTISLTGTNDAPTFLEAGLSTLGANPGGAVAEAAEGSEGGTHGVQGTIFFDDVDAGDEHSATADPQGGSYLGQLSLHIDQDTDTVDWLFSVADSDLDSLAQGETLEQLYEVTIGDGLASIIRTVAITLTGTNDDPQAGDDDALTVKQGAVATINVLANDGDVDGDTLSVGAVADPANGTAVINPDGTIQYTPDAGFGGTESFTYTVIDGKGGSDTATVTLEVEKPLVGVEAPQLYFGFVGLQYFMRVEGKTDWIELDGFQFGLSHPEGAATSGTELTALMNSGSGAAKLFAAAISGEDIPFVEIEAYTIDSAPQLVHEFRLDEVVVTGHEAAGETNPMQMTSGTQHSVSFSYGKIGNAHVGLGTSTTTGTTIDLEGDETGPGPAAMPDALAGARESFIFDDGLTFYLRVGDAAWMPVKSYSVGSGELTATLGSSEGLVDVTRLLASAAPVDSAEIEVYRGTRIVDEFLLDTVTLTALSTDKAMSTFSVEGNTLSLGFAGIDYGHQTYNPDRTPGEFIGHQPVGDAVVQEALPATMQYYMRATAAADGPAGTQWIRLQEFSFGLERSGDETGAIELTAVMGAGSGAAKLLQAATGPLAPVFASIEIEAYQGVTLVDEYKFDNVTMTGVDVNGALHEASFGYQALGHTHVATGAGMAWDFAAPGAGTPPAVLAEGRMGTKESAATGGLEYFLRVQAVDGPDKWIELDSYSLGVAGTASMEDISVTLGSSSELVELTSLLAQGAPIASAQIEVYLEGGQFLHEFVFDGVALTGLQTINAAVNTLTFDATTVEYNLANAEALNEPHAADAAPLQYFLKAEGLTSWIQLKEFSFEMTHAGSTGMSDVTATMSTGSGAARLFQAMADGDSLGSIEIEAYQNGNLVDEFRFQDVQLTRHEVEVWFQNDIPRGTSHTVGFEFAGFGHSHAGGSAMSLDVETGVVGDSGPALMPEAILPGAVAGPQEASVTSSLQYFLRIEGVNAPNEWLRLNSYTLEDSASDGAGGQLEVRLGSSSELIELTEALGSGEPLPYAELEAYRIIEDKRYLVDEFRFEDVVVSELLSTNATRNTLTFDYDSVSYANAFAYDPETGEVTGSAGGHTPDADLGFLLA